MNYISSLKKKKKKYLTKEEKIFLADVERFETLLKVYNHRLEYLKFNFETISRCKYLRTQNNEFFKRSQEIEECKRRIDFISSKLNEFYQK